ncbi:hypothetical protein [Staphylococcus simiae]|uniref:Uncharacterized protein n=1 Tax=Staphylococcus simiae CCM 7213 = CCUG 51256 TaxID=911238 RepID=G5JKJ2_9STAP|nr:hypothetical protein [Staphylococcus simiae]EHJ07301.1 hypothetical protein SS7213T_10064 [Staphylococcus simiae CCM 7213 = CCUG 51256]PNZ14332.1 hypothetical protein CD113_02500 [Staphylococcus simiae]SNV81060.1 Uncharacterised protein [Staphylococcus simiae]
MLERYIKVLGLYIITTLLSAIIVPSSKVANKVVKFVLRTMVGYSVFAYGLHFFSKLKSYKKEEE